MFEGETQDVAKLHMAIVKEVEVSGHPVPKPACLLSGGETTVTIRGNGKGGRNQEFSLAAVFAAAEMNKTVILSGGTDGTDGPTDAAGALTDNTTLERARSVGLDPLEYLANNDSYHFFDTLGDLLKTGPTHTNVMDLRVILID